jgi:SynChlorMet cassette radical SAM/SPASM protein ScmF
MDRLLLAYSFEKPVKKYIGYNLAIFLYNEIDPLPTALIRETEQPTAMRHGIGMSEPDRQKPLTQLYIFLENDCSLACRYCQAYTQPSLPGNGHSQALPLEDILQAIREALPLGLKMVRLCGGEPFLYPGLDTLLDRLERLELSTIIETSGSGLTARQANRLAHRPQTGVTVGLDGAGLFSHSLAHPLPAALEIATQAIRLLSDCGLAAQVHFTLTRQNYGQIGSIIRLVEELGAGSIHFTGIQPALQLQATGTNGSQLAPLNPDILTVEELIALGRKIERELVHTTRLQLSFDLPPAFRGLHPNARVEGQGRCAILNSLALLPSGEYALCGGATCAPALMLGRLGRDSLEQIWQAHSTLLSLREALPGGLAGICERCIMKTACLGFCAAENYLRTGKFGGPNWFCQAAERVRLFPAGRLIENLLY